MAKQKSDRAATLSELIESLSESRDVYILFLDLCDSTAFKEHCLKLNIPESIWITRQKVFLSRTAKIIRYYKGTIVKTIGDEIMATFSVDVTPASILNCCVETFEAFNSLKSYNKGNFKITCKAAVDFGSCYDGEILTNSVFDPIGTPVDRCARIARHSGPNKVVMSQAFYETYTGSNGAFDPKLITQKKDTFKGLGEITFYIYSGDINTS